MFNDDGTLNGFECHADHGLGEYTPMKRTVSLKGSCSCQFDVCSGIFMCRHKCKLVSVMYDGFSDEDRDTFVANVNNIARKWIADRSDVPQAVYELRSRPTDRGLAPRTVPAGTFCVRASICHALCYN
jgi:hypothetical protein